jgi:hypothetical protein
MTSLISIYLGGALTLGMALFHTQFHKLFQWDADYKKITPINKKVFHTLHLALLLLFFGLGFLTLFYAHELSSCIGLSFGINVIISAFWLWRAIWQIIYFNGKVMMHYVLTGYFFLLFIAYLIPLVMKLV